ncbi:MAG: hypothetical protein RSF82_13075, partial [Angelakisella sp.]
MLVSFSEYYNAALEQLKKPHADTELHGVLYQNEGLSFDNLIRIGEKRPLSMVDVRCDYLQQLYRLAQGGSYTEKQLRRAYASAYTTPISVSPKQLIEGASDELRLLLQNPVRLAALLTDRLVADYGLLGAVSIRLQVPEARLLLSYRDVQRRGIKVKLDHTPIFIFTPTSQSFFERDGRKVKAADATREEQLKILSGELTVTDKVQYLQSQYYDVSQLQMSNRDLDLLLGEISHREISWDAMKEMMSRLQSEDGLRLTLREESFQGMSVKSLYDPGKNTIYLKSHLSEAQFGWELTKRLCEATTQVTSTAPQQQKELEWRLLAAQAAHSWNVSPELTFPGEVSQAF